VGCIAVNGYVPSTSYKNRLVDLHERVVKPKPARDLAVKIKPNSVRVADRRQRAWWFDRNWIWPNIFEDSVLIHVAPADEGLSRITAGVKRSLTNQKVMSAFMNAFIRLPAKGSGVRNCRFSV